LGYFNVVFRGICWGFGIGAGKPTEIFAQKSLPGYSKLFQGSYYKPKRPKKPKMVKIETPPLNAYKTVQTTIHEKHARKI